MSDHKEEFNKRLLTQLESNQEQKYAVVVDDTSYKKTIIGVGIRGEGTILMSCPHENYSGDKLIKLLGKLEKKHMKQSSALT